MRLLVPPKPDENDENGYWQLLSLKKSSSKLAGNKAFNDAMDQDWAELRAVLGKITISVDASEIGRVEHSAENKGLVAANLADKALRFREAQFPVKAAQAGPGTAPDDGTMVTGKKISYRIMDFTDEEFEAIGDRQKRKMKRVVASLSKHLLVDAFESVIDIFDKGINQKAEVSAVMAEYEQAVGDVHSSDDPEVTRQTLDDLEANMALAAERLSFKAIPKEQ